MADLPIEISSVTPLWDQVRNARDGCRFRFTVADHGWADLELYFVGRDGSLSYRVSYLSDVLGDFVLAVLAVVNGSRPEASVLWELEPKLVQCEISQTATDELAVAPAINSPPRNWSS